MSLLLYTCVRHLREGKDELDDADFLLLCELIERVESRGIGEEVAVAGDL